MSMVLDCRRWRMTKLKINESWFMVHLFSSAESQIRTSSQIHISLKASIWSIWGSQHHEHGKNFTRYLCAFLSKNGHKHAIYCLETLCELVVYIFKLACHSVSCSSTNSLTKQSISFFHLAKEVCPIIPSNIFYSHFLSFILMLLLT